jgi:hypothetical protein
MRKVFAIVLAGVGAAAVAGVALAASRDTHILNVSLPDGSTEKIEYVGNVAPKVTVTPAAPIAIGFPSFVMFGRGMADMQRQMDAMMHQIDQMARQPIAGTPGMNVAPYGNAPAGSQGVTVVSTSNGAKTCTRTTEVTSQGPGKAPKVTSSVSGDCAGVSSPSNPGNPT